MRVRSVIPAGLLCATGVEAHYYWPWVIVNGTESPQWKYVRKVKGGSDNSLYALAEPHYDIFSTNFTCGRDAFDAAWATETADVVAGSEIGFRLNQGYEESVPSTNYGLNHQGPAFAYLARAPDDDLSTFSGGDGDWVKIQAILAESSNQWILHRFDQRILNITIPANIPPGKYLLRIEHIFLLPNFRQSQFFLNCAHVNIINNGKYGSFEGYQFAKFPGTYDYMDPNIWIGANMDLEKYVGPGPMVWEG